MTIQGPSVKPENKSRAIAGGPRDAAENFNIDFYNGIVRFLCHSTAFLLVFVCILQTVKKWQVLHRVSKKTVPVLFCE